MTDIDYSRFYAERIIVTEKGHAFIYWHSRKACLHGDYNYGKGKMHWLEYLGKDKPGILKEQYPNTSIQDMTDPRVNKYLKTKVREMERLVSESPY